jgi:serine/threonine protein kinase
MIELNKGLLDPSKESRSQANARAASLVRRWRRLCELYLPVRHQKDSIWRFNRIAEKTEPSQGWKLHISATILEACDLFEKVAPFLTSQDVQFKAPRSLDELSNINCGLQYGYVQVGKFITIYPSTEKQAVKLARELHELTRDFIPVFIPFDEQYLSGSSVFYRYGGFTPIEGTDENGNTVQVINNSAGKQVPDDRLTAIPEWLSNPFQNNGKHINADSGNAEETPLQATYKVFRAITQRGKGGTYHAFDLGESAPRFCIVKEGRRYGEIDWYGQDGYRLLKNEFAVLNALGEIYEDAPRVFSSFEIDGNFYLAMEYVEGESLHNLMRFRRRRFSIKQIVKYAIEIVKIVGEIHKAGWVWNDCKPGNLIVTRAKTLRPVDFEGSYPIDQSNPFDWKSKWFSRSVKEQSSTNSCGTSDDFYALGAVVYFLLTGRPYDAETPVHVSKARRNVPERLSAIVEKLLSDSVSDISDVGREFDEILKSI